ncbi:hypothetical protein ASL14_12240 [Paenibacillus sp. IHB B 3084]|uniref:hypothetical protein n=1 Tax=Paenibacillus sp. IHB B 3084 TaxID=867076 RepID=UPI000722BFEC|nr:hypothetical protein [Paenibacillus sp. IHB B 3084]ALP36818.1 hypothetical protein ASL14_12240 [Paenibacillus sp. IHB B 3084]
MAQSKEMRARAKKLRGRPVYVTLHSGETYVGYITDVNRGGLILAGAAGAPPHASSGMKDSRSLKRRAGSHAPSARLGNRRSGARKPPGRSRSRKPDAKVSAFLPMMGSLFGGLGGLGGMLGGGLRLFGMIQKFVPVVKMGYGMIKSIRPFLGAVQGLMPPAGPATPDNE